MLAKSSARCPPTMGSSRGLCVALPTVSTKIHFTSCMRSKSWVCSQHEPFCWKHPVRTRKWALAVICVAQFVVVLDVTIVTTALPAIRQALGFSDAGLQWVFTSYALVFGGLLIFGGRVADLAGRRRTFLIGLGLFAVASAGCALAWSPAALVAARSSTVPERPSSHLPHWPCSPH